MVEPLSKEELMEFDERMSYDRHLYPSELLRMRATVAALEADRDEAMLMRLLAIANVLCAILDEDLSESDFPKGWRPTAAKKAVEMHEIISRALDLDALEEQ